MIATLTGKLSRKEPDSAIIDVQGVGYELFISSRTFDELPQIEEQVFLYVQTNVREDAITLFGFTSMEEKRLFLLLNSVSGVGPKLAMAILSGLETSDLCSAISLKDMARLTSITGVGKKTAQRLCVELSDKVSSLFPSPDGAPGRAAGNRDNPGELVAQDVVSALINLGYSQEVAWQALRAAQRKNPDSVRSEKVDELIREALKSLA